MDGIAEDLGNKARVLRINVYDDIGLQVARRYGVRGLPTFIVFDGQGQPAYTFVGMPDRAKIVAQITQLLQSK